MVLNMCLCNSNYTWGDDDDDYYYPKWLKINMDPWAHPSTPSDDTSAGAMQIPDLDDLVAGELWRIFVNGFNLFCSGVVKCPMTWVYWTSPKVVAI